MLSCFDGDQHVLVQSKHAFCELVGIGVQLPTKDKIFFHLVGPKSYILIVKGTNIHDTEN